MPLQLTLLCCCRCGHQWSLGPYACKQCGSTELEHKPASGKGVVKSRTTIHRAPDTFWRQHVPYTVVLVALQEGAVLMGQAPNDIEIGQSVQASRVSLDGRDLLKFNPVP
jgi:uncharacterized OB-fold protein